MQISLAPWLWAEQEDIPEQDQISTVNTTEKKIELPRTFPGCSPKKCRFADTLVRGDLLCEGIWEAPLCLVTECKAEHVSWLHKILGSKNIKPAEPEDAGQWTWKKRGVEYFRWVLAGYGGCRGRGASTFFSNIVLEEAYEDNKEVDCLTVREECNRRMERQGSESETAWVKCISMEEEYVV